MHLQRGDESGNLCPLMTRESFSYPQTEKLLQLLDEAAARSAVSRGQAFEDFLEIAVCMLSGGQMEQQYLAVVSKHAQGEPGKRGCDSLAAMFGALIMQMESEPDDEMTDPLGDLFQGAITHGEAGQFLTPLPVCRAMARMTLADFELPSDRRATVSDPCCGSGRTLLAVAEVNRDLEFHGQDIDARCVRMTAINLALRNLSGYVVHGDSLRFQQRKVFRTGFNLLGFVREIPLAECPTPVRRAADASSHNPPQDRKPPESEPPRLQLDLF